MTDLPSVFIRRRRAWVVALATILFGLVVIALGEAERQPSPTETLPRGSDSATVARLQEQLPQGSGSTAIVLFTADEGTLSEQDISALQTSFGDLASTTWTAATTRAPPALGAAPAAGDRPGHRPGLRLRWPTRPRRQ